MLQKYKRYFPILILILILFNIKDGFALPNTNLEESFNQLEMDSKVKESIGLETKVKNPTEEVILRQVQENIQTSAPPTGSINGGNDGSPTITGFFQSVFNFLNPFQNLPPPLSHRIVDSLTVALNNSTVVNGTIDPIPIIRDTVVMTFNSSRLLSRYVGLALALDRVFQTAYTQPGETIQNNLSPAMNSNLTEISMSPPIINAQNDTSMAESSLPESVANSTEVIATPTFTPEEMIPKLI